MGERDLKRTPKMGTTVQGVLRSRSGETRRFSYVSGGHDDPANLHRIHSSPGDWASCPTCLALVAGDEVLHA